MSFNDVLHSFIDTLLDGMKYSVLKRKLNIRDITINAAHIEMAIIINQFELAFSSGKIPPDSLVLDSNHGVAVEFCNVFVTKDTDFVNSLNRIKGSVKINFDICTKPEQLRKKLGVQ